MFDRLLGRLKYENGIHKCCSCFHRQKQLGCVIIDRFVDVYLRQMVELPECVKFLASWYPKAYQVRTRRHSDFADNFKNFSNIFVQVAIYSRFDNYK